ncbi:hypothetical protein ACHWQZ_G006745 [Mnemiopsis leidyi]
MIINRLYYEAETKGWLSDKQAGFRARRSCEDQVLRMVQGVSDNFQAKPSKRTVMALIHYSNAYDRVWRVDLLLDLISLGCPMQMGLSQGAVSSPMLFFIYINGLADIIPEDMEAALFADDASFWFSDTDLNNANRRVQECMTRVAEWSKAKKMNINIQKSEITFFSNDPHEAKWKHNDHALEKEVPYNPNPKLLGVHRTLSFAKHVKYVTDKDHTVQREEGHGGSLPLANLPREPFPDAVQKPWTSSNCFEEWTTKIDLKEVQQPPQPNPTAGLFSCYNNRTPWDAQNNDHDADNTSFITKAAIQTIDGCGKDTAIYTDDLCKDGTDNGGAAALITTGSARNPIELEVLKRKGAKYTCSYDEEKNAMNLALDWTLEHNRSSDTLICSDSLSLITSIENRQSNVREIIEKLQQLKGRTIIQWVPSHSNIPGNELADKYAKEIAQDGEPPVTPLSYNAARAIIKREIRDQAPSHPTISKTY